MKKTNVSKPSASKTKVQDATLVHRSANSKACGKMPVATKVPPPPSAKSNKSSTSK